jgi:hypothetical protein
MKIFKKSLRAEAAGRQNRKDFHVDRVPNIANITSDVLFCTT